MAEKGFQKGHEKHGGRKKGTPNKRTVIEQSHPSVNDTPTFDEFRSRWLTFLAAKANTAELERLYSTLDPSGQEKMIVDMAKVVLPSLQSIKADIGVEEKNPNVVQMLKKLSQ